MMIKEKDARLQMESMMRFIGQLSLSGKGKKKTQVHCKHGGSTWWFLAVKTFAEVEFLRYVSDILYEFDFIWFVLPLS